MTLSISRFDLSYSNQKIHHSQQLLIICGSSLTTSKDFRIRVDAGSIKFPPVCPLCGTQATKFRFITKTKKDHIKQAVSPQYRRWRRTPFPIPTQRFSLDIPVCDRHYKTANELQQSRSTYGLMAGISAPISIMLITFIGFNWYESVLLPFQYYIFCVLSWSIFFWSVRKLGASDLERAISILDWVQGNPIILIRVRTGWYADEILTFNPSARVVGHKQRRL